MITDRQHGTALMMGNNNLPGHPAGTMMKTGPSSSTSASINGAQYTNYNTLIAWGIPALQTVAVLVARFVDADELLGEIDIVYCLVSCSLLSSGKHY